MCEPASFVLTEDKVFWSADTDSHTAIMTQNGLQEEVSLFHVNTLRVEITPPDGDFSKPESEWQFFTDQDVLPSWYDEVIDEARARKELTAWIKAKVITSEFRIVNCGTVYATGPNANLELHQEAHAKARHGASVVLRDHSEVVAYDNSHVIGRHNSHVTLCDLAEGDAYDFANVWLHQNSKVLAIDSTRVEAYEESYVSAMSHANVNAYEHSQVKATDNVLVRAYDKARVVATGHANVFANEHVEVEASGNVYVIATGHAVMHLSGEAVGVITDGYVTFTLADRAVCIDQRGSKPVVHTVDSLKK